MLTSEQITELKAKHGSELAAVEGPVGTLVFKKPSRLVYDKWRDKHLIGGDGQSANAREFAQACLAFPDYAQFVASIDANPTLLMGEVLQAILLLAGSKDEYEVKKL
jgi:hypothetical protein